MTALKIMWIQGTTTAGKTNYFNLNAIMGLEQYNEDDFIVFLGGGERVYLEGCTFTDAWPDFVT